jgi:hypothetical protein
VRVKVKKLESDKAKEARRSSYAFMKEQQDARRPKARTRYASRHPPLHLREGRGVSD